MLGAYIRAQRQAAGLSLRDLADRAEVSNAYLSQVERGMHEPSLSVLHAVSRALDLSLDAMLTSAGVLESPDAPAPTETEAAILRDPDLTAPQRTALLSVYRSFVPRRRI